MTRLLWGQAENRRFETGLDRGVLYPKNVPPGPIDAINKVLNPSYERESTLTTVTRNRCVNPRAISTGTTAEYQSRWSWTSSWITGAGDGPIPAITTYNRQTCPALQTAVNARGTDWYSPLDIASPATSGNALLCAAFPTEVITISVYWRSSVACSAGISYRFHDGVGNWVIATVNAGTVAVAANTWTRLSVTVTVPAGATHLSVSPRTHVGTDWAAGATIDTTGLMVQRWGVVADYFDGSTETGQWVGPDFTPTWSGTANASATDMRVMQPLKVGGLGSVTPVQSSAWAADGNYSVRLVPSGMFNDSYLIVGGLTADPDGRVQLELGKTYTIVATSRLAAAQTGSIYIWARRIRAVSTGATTNIDLVSTAAPNAAGVTEHRLTFTVPSNATTMSLRLYNGALPGNGEVWWDNVSIVEGTFTGPSFNGNTESELYNYGWYGEQDNSASYRQTIVGTAIPWDGLISVDESGADSATSYYVDGRPFLHVPRPKEFQATIHAYTYPDEFAELQGLVEATDGMFLDSQMGDSFGLSYRTKVGNGVDGVDHAYKIHLVYNATVTPQGKTFDTIGSEINPIDFSWDIQAVPVPVEGYRATAHIIVDTRNMAPDKLALIENLLYGGDDYAPRLPDPQVVFDTLTFGDTIIITDNGDGTWTAEASYKNLYLIGDGIFQIDNVNAVDHGDGTFTVSSTP